MFTSRINPMEQALRMREQQKGQEEDFATHLQQAEADQLRQAAEDMEGIFLNQLLEQMWRTVPGENKGEKAMFQGMYIEELSKLMSSAGGIGLADFLVAQMKED